MVETISAKDTPAMTPAPRLSVVTPAYNEEQNLPVLYARLCAVMAGLGDAWEWIVVDDHSGDGTFSVLEALAARDARVRGIRLARNSGSHTALMCGLHHARGASAVMLAADLQDPPEIIVKLVEKWQAGAQIVWAARQAREGEKATTVGAANLYYWIMRHFVGVKEIPAKGADVFLIDRVVIDALNLFREANVSVFALLTWMGFRQERIYYVKQARLHGQSGWSFEKKLKMVVDSVTSFTYLPIRLMSGLGFLTALAGAFYALFIIYKALRGEMIPGWSSLMVMMLFLGGIQMVMMGVLGEYLWRALDEARRRPRYLIERRTGTASVEMVPSTAN